MKKILIIFTILILIFTSIFSVFASSNISFELSDCNSDKNRLFTVDMIAQSDLKLSAATFEFTYNKSLFEFRSIKANNDNSKISYNELDNCIKVVFLNAFGQDIKNKDVIFTLSFKSVNSGTGNIDFSVCECVSPNIEFIDIGTCISSTVNINENYIAENNNSNNSSEKSTSEKETSESKKSKIENNTTVVSTIDELGVLNPIDNWDARYFFIGLCLGVGTVILVLLIYFISRKILKKFQHKNDKSSD